MCLFLHHLLISMNLTNLHNDFLNHKLHQFLTFCLIFHFWLHSKEFTSIGFSLYFLLCWRSCDSMCICFAECLNDQMLRLKHNRHLWWKFRSSENHVHPLEEPNVDSENRLQYKKTQKPHTNSVTHHSKHNHQS